MDGTITLKKPTPGHYCNEWLKSFPLFQKHVPMRVGILEELKLKQREIKRAKFGWREIRKQLRNRSRKDWYRAALRERMPRCNLDGTEVDQKLNYHTGKEKPLDS